MFQFGKGLAKIAIVAGAVLWSEHGRIKAFAQLEPAATLQVVLLLSIRLMRGIHATHIALALGDALYQRYPPPRTRLRRSKEEMKQSTRKPRAIPG